MANLPLESFSPGHAAPIGLLGTPRVLVTSPPQSGHAAFGFRRDHGRSSASEAAR